MWVTRGFNSAIKRTEYARVDEFDQLSALNDDVAWGGAVGNRRYPGNLRYFPQMRFVAGYVPPARASAQEAAAATKERRTAATVALAGVVVSPAGNHPNVPS